MSLTKDEVSDLKALVDRVVQAQLELARASRDLTSAQSGLEKFFFAQTVGPKRSDNSNQGDS